MKAKWLWIGFWVLFILSFIGWFLGRNIESFIVGEIILISIAISVKR
ncbi:MAG: hypothetical protein HQK77_14215 [Desulfobacterales bacterium]|nr:hypothetical protein [Desulfobacterales bacterium]